MLDDTPIKLSRIPPTQKTATFSRGWRNIILTLNLDEFQVTLSGLLNFIDGLWSSCGDERIIIFTTNHKDKLDPALLRPGRMDMHINMSYCTPCGFKMLASNYLDIIDHPLFSEVEDLIVEAKATPAEVGEQLMKNEDPDIALEGLIQFLVEKKESDAAKARETELKAVDKEDEEKSGSENPQKTGEVDMKMMIL